MLDVLCVYIMNELYHMVISTGIRLLWFIWSSTQFSQVKYYFRLLMLRAIRIRCKSTSCQQHFLYCSLFGFFFLLFLPLTHFCSVRTIFMKASQKNNILHKRHDKIWSIKTTLRAFLSKKKICITLYSFIHTYSCNCEKKVLFLPERER